MRVYVACSMREMARAAAFRESLRTARYFCTSRWIDRPWDGRPESELSEQKCLEIAGENEADMDDAEVLVALSSPQVRGLLVEVGYMAGARKPVLFVGPYPGASLMVGLRRVFVVADEAAALAEPAKLAR